MKIFHDLNFSPPLMHSIVLTIGNFDGMHLGHQAVLKRVNNIARLTQGKSAVITFVNHPSEVLHPHLKIPFICTLDHKIKLLEKEDIDFLILLSFTKTLSEHTAEAFLNLTRNCLPFSHLILGHDATFGKNKQGDRKNIEKYAQSVPFAVEYINEFRVDGMRVSSSKIREFIQKKEFVLAEKLLGRPYSIYGKVTRGKQLGKLIGFPTANLEVAHLCLPPLGVYAVRVKLGHQWLEGVANLGIAPTVREDKNPILEVHLFNHQEEIYNHHVEVVFCDYIRAEEKFSNLEALKEQIKKDVEYAKTRLMKTRQI